MVTRKEVRSRRTRAQGPHGRSLYRFPYQETYLGVLLLPPERDASPSQGYKYLGVEIDQSLGNLRTTTKFTTTTSLDWEKTGTRTSVSAGKRKLKMQSVGRLTTTTLNVNTNVKL